MPSQKLDFCSCDVNLELHVNSCLGQIGPLRKEKLLPGTPPAPVAASHCPESEDLIQSLTPPQHPPGPGCSENPKQESDSEPCSAANQQNLHTGGVTPKPEVCLLCLFS